MTFWLKLRKIAQKHLPMKRYLLFPFYFVTAFGVSVISRAQIFEAEVGKFSGHTRQAWDEPAGSGRTWVTGFEKPGDALTLTLTMPTEGDQILSLICRNSSEKYVPIMVNGQAQGSAWFPTTTHFLARLYGRIHLQAGDNSLRIGTDWGYADIDAVQLAPAPPPVPFQLSAQPVNPKASSEARKLYQNLIRAFGSKTLAGQHESRPRQPSRLAHIAKATHGAQPALLGLDLITYSGANVAEIPDGAIEGALDWVLQRQGVVTLSWHWFSPLGGKDPVWSSFYTEKTTFDPTRIFDEKSPEFAAFMRDLDLVATQLQRLRDAHVPVLWRPLHEAQGGWFWWGSRGPETTRRLYRMMFDYFTNTRRLDNLIWVWTSTDRPDALAWYPGDDVVDIIAVDLYAREPIRGNLAAAFDRLRERYSGRKPLALGECDLLPVPDARAPWLWFLVWDDFITRDTFNPDSVIRETYADPRVITLERLPAYITYSNM